MHLSINLLSSAYRAASIIALHVTKSVAWETCVLVAHSKRASLDTTSSDFQIDQCIDAILYASSGEEFKCSREIQVRLFPWFD